MESIIKSAEDVRAKSLDNARRLHEEYQAQKHDVISRISQNQQILGNISLPFLAHENDPVPPK